MHTITEVWSSDHLKYDNLYFVEEQLESSKPFARGMWEREVWVVNLWDAALASLERQWALQPQEYVTEAQSSLTRKPLPCELLWFSGFIDLRDLLTRTFSSPTPLLSETDLNHSFQEGFPVTLGKWVSRQGPLCGLKHCYQFFQEEWFTRPCLSLQVDRQ